jgi:hypothetical protein
LLPKALGQTVKFVAVDVTFVATGPAVVPKIIVYGARPLLGVTTRLAHAPRHRFVRVGVIAQTGFGFTTTVALHEPVQPLESVIEAV